MTTPQLVAGYDTELTVYLVKNDGTPDNITGATEVKVGLANRQRSRTAIGPYLADANHAGADWSVGKVTLTVPGTDTDEAARTVVYADAKVTIGAAIRPYFADDLLEIMPGNL